MDLTTIKIAGMISMSSMADHNNTTHHPDNELAILPPHSHGSHCLRSGSRCRYWVLREQPKMLPKIIKYNTIKHR